MRTLLSIHGLRGNVELSVGLGVQLGALAAGDAPVATGVMPTGAWR